jgi:F-type H+-transporting ATPase subunit delta
MNPVIDLDERGDLIRSISQIAGWETYLQNFLLLLVDNHRLSIVGEINEVFRQQIEKREGKLRTRVETAQPLTDDQEESIENALARVTGKDIILETNVDECLLGGVVARLGSMVYDGSVRTKLDSLQGLILERI